MDIPISGHVAEHDVISTMVETRIPTSIGGRTMRLRTSVTNGEPDPTSITDPEASGQAVFVADTRLVTIADHIGQHKATVDAVVKRHEAALEALGESWALDTSVDPEHVEA